MVGSKEVIGGRWGRVAAAPNLLCPSFPSVTAGVSPGVRCFPPVSVRVRWWWWLSLMLTQPPDPPLLTDVSITTHGAILTRTTGRRARRNRPHHQQQLSCPRLSCGFSVGPSAPNQSHRRVPACPGRTYTTVPGLLLPSEKPNLRQNWAPMNGGGRGSPVSRPSSP